MSLTINLIVIVLLAIILGAVGYNYHYTMLENKRLRSDVNGLNTALIATIDTTRNNYNQMRAQTQTIVLSENESRRFLSGEIQNIKNGFGVRLQGIESYTKAGVRYTVPIVVKSRDTVIFNRVEKIYALDSGRAGQLYTRNDSLIGTISLNDTIRITVSKGRRERWWRLWEKRPLVTNAFMGNPKGTIISLKSVVVK